MKLLNKKTLICLVYLNLHSKSNVEINISQAQNNEAFYSFYYPARFCTLIDQSYYFLFKLDKDCIINSISKGIVVSVKPEKNSISIRYENNGDIIMIKYKGVKNIKVVENEEINKGDILGNALSTNLAIRILVNDLIKDVTFENIQ